jgi:hypothetical protein
MIRYILILRVNIKLSNFKKHITFKYDSLELPIDPSHDLFCKWPKLSGLGPSCTDPTAMYNPCARACSTLDCFNNLEDSCQGNEPFIATCECKMGYILNNGVGVKLYSNFCKTACHIFDCDLSFLL